MRWVRNTSPSLRFSSFRFVFAANYEGSMDQHRIWGWRAEALYWARAGHHRPEENRYQHSNPGFFWCNHSVLPFEFTLSFIMPAEPVISCCVREESAKASKQSAPFVEVRMLCVICQDGSILRASQHSHSDYFSSAELLKKRWNPVMNK